MPSFIEKGLRPLDRLRQVCLKALMPWIRPLIVERERRVTVTGILLMSTALIGVILIPLWMLALGPIIWGVPHILSDVRYLAIRPGFIKRKILWLVAGVPLVIVGYTGDVYIGFIGALGALWVSSTSNKRLWLGTVVLLFLIWGSHRLGYQANLIFAHAHNFIAVGLWWMWRQRQDTLHWLPLAFFLLISGGLLFGMADPYLGITFAFPWTPPGNSMSYHLGVLAPGFSQQVGVRIVLLFAFAQTIHYVVWLRLIPEEDRPQPTPRSFSSSYRALQADFGTIPIILIACSSVILVGWALMDLAAARVGYLRLAIFHGHLELIALALFWAEGTPAAQQFSNPSPSSK